MNTNLDKSGQVQLKINKIPVVVGCNMLLKLHWLLLLEQQQLQWQTYLQLMAKKLLRLSSYPKYQTSPKRKLFMSESQNHDFFFNFVVVEFSNDVKIVQTQLKIVSHTLKYIGGWTNSNYFTNLAFIQIFNLKLLSGNFYEIISRDFKYLRWQKRLNYTDRR